jgi:N-methylhydantoinase B
MTLDAVGLEIMAHAFASVAEEMGAVLIRSALSPNIRERRDCSAALFDARGEMIAQAAHIPVHLGAMPEAVAAVRAQNPHPGDVFILNDPYTGGTHLPDITLVAAIGLKGSSEQGAGRSNEVIGYTVVRAHHSDVGGMIAGSMPAGAREVFAEGIVIPPVRLEEGVERLILANVRTPEVRAGDLAAQRAAAERGAERWRELVARYGRAGVEDAVKDLLDYAERRTRAAIRAKLKRGTYRAEDWLEGDGVTDEPMVIKATVEVGEVLKVDFTGTAPAAAGNVNCPLSVTRSAVLFVLRTLVDDDVPTNGGVQRCVRVTAPEGCLVNAKTPSAVAAGNVETSQRIADVVFLALAKAGISVPAQGQGTMNNVTFGGKAWGVGSGTRRRAGGEPWTYYETLGGGQGASAVGPGPSGVHVGMSNTRNTPIEGLEMDHPVRILRYELRAAKGGGGRHRGGRGVVREYQALEPMTVSLLTERREIPPKGAGSRGPGAVGRNTLNGKRLGSKTSFEMKAGDVLRIETPGGGGSR